ncbi:MULTISPECIES: hypothetical protein [Shouchella]|uniref:hypothetical protein n=1 Tax=Shouchella TaxID=2893057 RepID=UPI0004E6CE5A|nr:MULTISPECIES: hypothetical protein [Shouchella]ALA55217.1 hypothetical protein DB29_0P0005 [Shouchella clausii]MBU3266253.1 hypothetical protein [Shouchella clausii]MBU3509346.1 hypothetical protein [Shouchella clausii]MDP0462066.1 hypothetical protein [Shouchella rhizosphaerae]MDP5267791.1 hypothetical protein [Shouchella clausii]
MGRFTIRKAKWENVNLKSSRMAAILAFDLSFFGSFGTAASAANESGTYGLLAKYELTGRGYRVI